MQLVKRVKNNTTEELSIVGITLPADEQYYVIPLENWEELSNLNNVQRFIDGEIIFNNGTTDIIDAKELVIFLVAGTLESGSGTGGDVDVTVEFTPHDHASTHQTGGNDEISVEGLSGILNDSQHPIESEVLAMMGAKSDANPLNHDKFNQSDITGLSEDQVAFQARIPSSAEKNAMTNSSNPSSVNPFITKNTGDSTYSAQAHSHTEYSETTHTHSTLPSVDQKNAMDHSTSPSTDNPFATLSDLQDAGLNYYQNFTALLNDSSKTWNIDDFARTMEDETISTNLYEAGWYIYVGGTSGTHGSAWSFKSSKEDHTHDWNQINKVGSKLADISDIPTTFNVGVENILVKLDGTLSWQAKADSNVQKKTFTMSVQRQASSSVNVGSWFDAMNSNRDSGSWSGFTSNKVYPFMIPFDCKLKKVVLRARGAYYEWISGSQDYIKYAISLMSHEVYDANEVAKFVCEVPGTFSDGLIDYTELRGVEENPTLEDGTNIFNAGDLIGVMMEEPDGDQPGDVYKLRYPVLLLEFEEL